jgi:signal peptidase I
MVRKLFGAPGRGNIVMLKYSGDQAQYVGRIIGMPGESIQIQDEAILINGKRIDEVSVTVRDLDVETKELSEVSDEGQGAYRIYYTARNRDDEYGIPGDTFGLNGPFQIPPNSYFVMGDNRDNSNDSRYRGAVPAELIWGEISRVVWSESEHNGEVRWDRVGKQLK